MSNCELAQSVSFLVVLVQVSRMVLNVITDECGDEKVAMVVALKRIQ